MRGPGVGPDAIIHSAIIDCCARDGDMEGAESTLAEMQCEGVTPIMVHYCPVLHACAQSGDGDPMSPRSGDPMSTDTHASREVLSRQRVTG